MRAKEFGVVQIAEALGRTVEGVTALLTAEAKLLRDNGRPQAARAIEAGARFHGGYRIREPGKAASHGHERRLPGPSGFSSFAERAAAIAAARLEGQTMWRISLRFGISESRVSKILNQERWLLRKQGEHERAAELGDSLKEIRRRRG